MPGNEREAGVKLVLRTGSYIGALKAATRETVEYGRQWGRALKGPTVAGLKELGREIRNTASEAKNAAKFALTLGGAFSFGNALKGATESRKMFRDMAFAIQSGTGEMVDWQDLQKDAQTTALRWGSSTRELGKAFDGLREDLGDIGLAKVGMEQAAIASRATGKDVGVLSGIVGTLAEKFAVTGEEMPDALAAAISLGNKGGITLEQMGEKLGLLGASARAAGLGGQAGFQQIVGMANVADNAMGSFKKSLTAVTGLLDSFGTPEQAKKIADSFGVAVKDAQGNARDFNTVMGEIFAKTKGKREALAKGFSGEQLKLVLELGKVFRETFEGTSGDVRKKTAAALDAYKKNLADAGASQLTAADIAKRAAENMAQDPQARLAQALERLEQAFAKPKMIAAIDKMAERLPEAAEKLTKLVDFVLDNPKTAAGIVLGMKVGAPFLSGAMQAAAPAVGKAILSGLTTQSAAAAFAPSGAAPGMLAKGAGVVGSTVAVAGAGLAGFAAGNELADRVVDPMVNEIRGRAVSLDVATKTADINTTGKFSREGAEQSIAALRSSLEAAKKDREFSWKDVASLGLRRLGTASEGDISKGEDQLAKSEAALREKLGPAADKSATALDRMAPAAEKTATSLDKVGTAADRMAAAADRIARTAAGVAPSSGAAATSGPPPRGPMPVSPARPGYLPRG